MPTVKKPIEQVRNLVEAGAPVADAIRIAIGGNIPAWAARHDLHRGPAQMTISGRRVPPDRRVFAALLEDLGADEQELRELLATATMSVTAVAS